MSNRSVENAIAGFLLLLFLSLIGWNIALYYNFPMIPVIGIFIGTFGFFMLGVVWKTSN